MTATAVTLARPRARAEAPRTDWIGYLFVAFFTLPFLIFNIGPILFGAYLSFTKWGIFGRPKWVGLQNFRDAFADEFTIIAFKNTILYGIVIVPCVTVIGLAFALYVHQRWPLSGLARTLFFSPYVVSATVIGLVWVWMLDTQFGLVNHYLAYVGLPEIPWLTSTNWSLIGVSIASVWWDLGLVFVLLLAALQDVPRELYEAAEVDGATRWQKFVAITLPMLRPAIMVALIFRTITAIQTFDIPYAMTGGGPGDSTETLAMYIQKTTLDFLDFGYGSALAALMFVLSMIVTSGYLRYTRRTARRGED
jgi:multiple sugar transport system permease protein